MNNKLRLILAIITLFNSTKSFTQSYHGLNSSPYFGVGNIYINPASSVNSFYRWDATIFGLQFNTAQTTFQALNTSLQDVNKITDSNFQINQGFSARNYHGIMDGQGLSFRYKIDEKRAIAFSLRGRTYNHFKSNNLFYSKDEKEFSTFLGDNISSPYANLFYTTSSWFETNINYSQIISSSQNHILSIGGNIGFVKSLAGGRFDAINARYQKLNNPSNGKTYYQFTQGDFNYMYSQNISLFDSVKLSAQSFNQFLKSSLNTTSLSIGIEYLFTDDDDNEDVSTTNYSWKLGAAIMDIGKTKYNYVNGSAHNSNPKSFTDTILNYNMIGIKSLKKFRDSFSTMFNTTDTLNGTFSISLPTRLVLTADKKIAKNFYVNAEASINFLSSSNTKKYNTREINFITLTPRLETQLFGAYLPVQYTTQGNFFVGAAIKIGPLIMGIHDFSVLNWFKKQNQTFNSGGYFMLNIYPYKSKKKIDGEIKCPKV